MSMTQRGIIFVFFLFFSGVCFAQSQSQPQVLTFLNWSEYMDPALIKAFEKKHNAQVKEFFFETDEIKEEMLLESKGQGYDVVLSSGMRIPRYMKQNWLSKISQTQIPNLRHMDERWRNARPEIAEFAVPYLWGTCGIAYRKDLVKKEVTTWLDLYRPSQDLQGKILMINDSHEAVGLGLKALGYPLNSEDKTHYEEVRDLLLKQKPYVHDYSYVAVNPQSSLVTGEIWMAMVYNGDGLMLQELHPQIVFTIPREGTSLWVDYLMIMEGSADKELAHAFVNFLTEPENAAQLAEYLMFATPNKTAMDLLPPDHRNNPMIYPDLETLEKSETYRALSPKIIKMQVTIFAEVTQ